MKNRELLILQPAATKPEELEELKEDRPFVMYGTVPKGSMTIQVLTIPTIVDMIGFSSGGGPPGFAYFINPDEKEVEHCIWLLLAPGITFDVDEEIERMGEVLGVVMCLGVLLCGVEVRGDEAPIKKYLEYLKSKGCMVFDVVPYKIPDLMKQRAFPHATGKPAV